MDNSIPKILSGHQPTYLPWLGLFHKALIADIWVFEDFVQYQPKDWYNRNYIKTPNGRMFLTVPVDLRKGSLKPIKEIKIDTTQKWQQEHDNFKFIPVISEPKPEHDWQGRTGLVHEAILQDYPQLDNYQIYACGSPEMIDAGRAPFMAKGLPEDQYFADKFSSACYKAPLAEASVSSEGVTHG